MSDAPRFPPPLTPAQPPKPTAADAPAPEATAKKPRRKVSADGTVPAPRKRRTVKAEPPPPPPPPRRLWWAFGVALAVLGIDQLTKWIVVQALNLKEIHDIDVIDPWLNLRMAWNQGVNFGLLGSDADLTRWVLIGIAAAICLWVTVWLIRVRPGALAQAAAGLLIGGALGNVIDRITYGAVADFLNMSLPAWRNPYSFNVADIAIFAGALGLVFQPGPRTAAPSGAAGDKTGDGRRKIR